MAALVAGFGVPGVVDRAGSSKITPKLNGEHPSTRMLPQ